MTTSSFRKVMIGLILITLTGSAASVVEAHSGAKGVTKERMELMKGLADAMKAMGAMFKGEAVFEPAIILEKAGLLAVHAKRIPGMTPEGSNDHPSEALPVIWEAWDGYVASAKELEDESAKLADVASNGADETETRVQYVKVSKTCGTCHDRFRKPKE